jgi:hypothetical protein
MLGIALALAGCTAGPPPLPPEAVLDGRANEVARGLGLGEVHVDRAEGLFIWRYSMPMPDTAPAGVRCEGLLAWHIRPVDGAVGLDDPVNGLCTGEPGDAAVLQLRAAMRALQEEFKQRWLALVGPVTIIGPTPETHAADVRGAAVARALENLRRALPTSPAGG